MVILISCSYGYCWCTVTSSVLCILCLHPQYTLAAGERPFNLFSVLEKFPSFSPSSMYLVMPLFLFPLFFCLSLSQPLCLSPSLARSASKRSVTLSCQMCSQEQLRAASSLCYRVGASTTLPSTRSPSLSLRSLSHTPLCPIITTSSSVLHNLNLL